MHERGEGYGWSRVAEAGAGAGNSVQGIKEMYLTATKGNCGGKVLSVMIRFFEGDIF